MRSPVVPRGPLWAVPVALCFVLAASCSDGGNEASDDDGNAGENGNGGSAGSTGGNGGSSGDGSGGSSGAGGASGGSGGAGGSTGGAGGVGGGAGGAGGAGGVTGGAGGVTGGGAGMDNGGGVGGASAAAGAGGAGGAGGATAGVGGSTGGGAGDAAGGSAGAGPVLCGSTFVVADDGFVKAPPATGACWYGYATAGGDSGSLVTPTSFATCGAGCMLRASGTVNAATEANSYAGVVYLGFNLKQEPSTSTIGTVTPTGSGLVVNYTNTGASPTVRIQIASGTTRWCATLTPSPVTVPWAMFNTECWEGGAGTAYAKQPIDTVQLVIPGGAASAPFDVTLVSVKDT